MSWSRLHQMMLKEMRTTLRERQQLITLVISVLFMCFAFGFAGFQFSQEHRRPGAAAAVLSSVPINALRWAVIGVGAGIGVLFTFGYLVSATVAAFAGEREARMLEILLMAPVSDRALFRLKCVSVLLPMAALGYLCVGAATLLAYVLAGSALSAAPIAVAAYVLLLSPPVALLCLTILLGIGVAISARAETVKGASQVFGGVFMVVFFGGCYGIPLLLGYTALGGVVKGVVRTWLAWPFAAQYGFVLLVLSVPAAIAMGVALAMFRRDRLIA